MFSWYLISGSSTIKKDKTAGSSGGKMPAIKDGNIVKIAVEMQDKDPHLMEFDQKRPLPAIISDLCNRWGLSIDNDQFALQFSDSTLFITEKNRSDIKNGSVLRLTNSPSKTAQDILDKMNSAQANPEEKKEALQRLMRLAPDNTFAQEFIYKQGLTLLINSIENALYSGELLAYVLISFVELMEHGIVLWDVLEPKFISKIASYVVGNGQNQYTIDLRALQFSLTILDNIVLQSTSKSSLVEQEVTLPNLVAHLQSNSVDIQLSALSLINALLIKSDWTKRRTMAAAMMSKPVRTVILNSVIQSQRTMGSELAHQLSVLQTLLMNLLEKRMMTPLDSQDQDATAKIIELRKIAFENESSCDVVNSHRDNVAHITAGTTARRQAASYTRDYKRLGFSNTTNPAEDFLETPPGMLALDNMVYFARNHTEAYSRVVLENSSRSDDHECPFARTSIHLTKLLCELLKISEPTSEQGQTYYPMFFTHDHPFEEFFSICVPLLNKTWKEMRATVDDFIKVFGVVQQQITRALSGGPAPPLTFEKFRQKLATLTYSEITNLWQQERSNREEWESQATPIVELREQIKPEIIDLIQQQRLNYLVEGTLFIKYSTKGQRQKDKFWFCRLSPNHKTFHYGECDENAAPAIEDLPSKISVVSIKMLLTGKDCPHMKDAKAKKTSSSLAFSLQLDDMECVNFVAADENAFDYWTDGINALIGQPMTSKQTAEDLETLLSMDIKLRLLDTEGVKIPEHPPPIPKEPPNYDFCFDFK